MHSGTAPEKRRARPPDARRSPRRRARRSHAGRGEPTRAGRGAPSRPGSSHRRKRPARRRHRLIRLAPGHLRPAPRRVRLPAAIGRRRADALPLARNEGRMWMSRKVMLTAVSLASMLALATPAFAANVSVGSPPDNTPQNHQNEPAVAIDANHPSFNVSGWNDFVDWARARRP